MRRRLPRPLLAAVVAAAAATPLALWQAGDPAGAAKPGLRGFMVVSTDDCNDWKKASRRDKLKVVEAMGDHFGHASHIWEGARLPTHVAADLFDRACRSRKLRDVRLYKIYARALVWSGEAVR